MIPKPKKVIIGACGALAVVAVFLGAYWTSSPTTETWGACGMAGSEAAFPTLHKDEHCNFFDDSGQMVVTYKPEKTGKNSRTYFYSLTDYGRKTYCGPNAVKHQQIIKSEC